MKRQLSGLLLCVLLLLCGCRELPEEVAENMQEYGDNHQMKASPNSYCSIEELKKAGLPDQDAGALSLPDDVDFSKIEEVSVLHLSVEEDFLSDANVECFMELFGLKGDQFTKRSSSGFGMGIFYEDEAGDHNASIEENGGLVWMEEAAIQKALQDTVEERVYNIDRGEASGVRVLMADGEVDLAEFCEEKGRWLEENFPMEGIRGRVADVAVRKQSEAGSDARMLYMCVEYEYKGIGLNNHAHGTLDTAESGEREVQSIFTLMNFEDSELPYFLSRNKSIVIDSVEPVERVVDLESAVKSVREALSGFGPFQISEIIPLYVLYLEERAEMENGSFAAEGPGAKLEARPAYAFLAEVHSKTGNGALIKSNDYAHYLFVDMVTGELSTDSALKRIH